ncbi:MAG: quinolinate synthase [Candidatus Zixiibacteriota bacterium]|nr:MAG: quinolinate synthase [candidate division Zixibacteria bacterium]
MFFVLPKEYREASLEELRERVGAAKAKLGRRLCILTHHYQRMEVVAFGDHLGDSYGLSKIAAVQEEADIIIFCGVHFMAEAADILTARHQKVYLSNPLAGCPMADMADMADVTRAWDSLKRFGGEKTFMPISYMNTAADLKAFTGKFGGLICTSSNADAALRYAFERKEKVFFCPDRNLGQNAGIKMGLKPHEMALWDFSREQGGLTDEEIERAKIIVWKGHCHVHTNFTVQHVDAMREKHPNAQIIVHPECIPEVVAKADTAGSTSLIVKYCADAPSGSTIAIGTELNLIDRLAHDHPDKTILPLSEAVCPVCPNMYRTTLNCLAYCVEKFADIEPISVSDELRSDVHLSLQRMLEVQ